MDSDLANCIKEMVILATYFTLEEAKIAGYESPDDGPESMRQMAVWLNEN